MAFEFVFVFAYFELLLYQKLFNSAYLFLERHFLNFVNQNRLNDPVKIKFKSFKLVFDFGGFLVKVFLNFFNLSVNFRQSFLLVFNFLHWLEQVGVCIIK